MAMNQMKYQILRERPDLDAYFRWKPSRLPPAFKINSMAFYLALMVCLLGGLVLGAAVTFYYLSIEPSNVSWTLAIGTGMLGAIILIVVYWFLLWRVEIWDW